MADENPFGKMSDFEEESPGGKWILPIIAFGFSAIMFVFGALFGYYGQHDAATLTATATATVKGDPHERSVSDCNGSGHSCSRKYYCSFQYVFPAPMGGEGHGEYEDDDECGDEQANGAQRQVFFNPEDITESSLRDPSSLMDRYGWILFVFLGIFVLGVGVKSLPRRRKTDEST